MATLVPMEQRTLPRTLMGRRPAHEEMNLRKGYISTRQLSDLTGVSMRLLDYWLKSEIIVPHHVEGDEGHGKGSRRVFREDVAVPQVYRISRAVAACPYGHKSK